jgi:thiamine biosynthesis protein ThiI
MAPTNETFVHLTLSGDVYLKSRRTQKKLISRARNNLGDALDRAGYRGSVERIGLHRYQLHPADAESLHHATTIATQMFGFGSVETVAEIPFGSLDELAHTVADVSAQRVAGRTFAVRVKRRGTHEWRSTELAVAAGTQLVAAGGRVDLDAPEVTVRVSILDDHAFVVTDHERGAGGLPLGTQERVLCLLSGGFDSVVAAWMLMSRGCPVDFVHFSLNCAQSDHALAVARELWSVWGHGTMPEVHLVEFQPVKDALFTSVDAHMRQVTLKVMMAKAASDVAAEQEILAIATGDSMGQVSSQTLPHLAAVSQAATVPILRPLVGLPKDAIIDLARRIGTAELSARAQEVCDLSEGRPVATSAREHRISRSVERVPAELLADAVATRKTFHIADWHPGRI